MNPDLGVLLFSDYTTAELVDLAVSSEALGYRWFWYTDNRFARDCYLGLAAVAAKTQQIRLGTGVTDPYSRHPALTACAIATLDEMCGGRAVLGLGVGTTGFRELGLDRKLPVAALRETVEIVRGLLRGEQVTLAGKVVGLAGGKLTFAPTRPDIPVYFATHGAQITRLAGQIADGVLIANTLAPRAFAHYLDRLDEGLARAGRDPAHFDIGLRVEACIADDDAAAFAVMRRRAAARLLGQYPHWEHLTELGIDLPPAFAELAQARPPDAAERAAPLLPRAAVETMVLAGNPDSVARQLARALHPRVSQLTVRPHAIKGQSVAAVIRSFAEQVVPRALQLRASMAAR
jgi:5,10-methylenetetrahydromethanopterin reductase